MTTRASQFTGSIPADYQRHLAPVIFEPYAVDLAARCRAAGPRDVLEVACGTGVLTRHLIQGLRNDGSLVATDLNDAMLAVAQAQVPLDARLSWRVADGTALPFDERSFDEVICQFGVMFFPDKAQGMKEARRVLRPGGTYHFNVWDGFDFVPFGRIAHFTIKSFFDADAPNFYLTPFGFADEKAICAMLSEAGFREISVERVKKEAVSPSAKDFATGLIRGNPVVAMIAERGTVDPQTVIDAIEKRLIAEGGDRPHRSPIQALVVTAKA